MITRIAPTPSGYLHKGNLFNFLLNWLWARANGGKVLLRIDDADADRKRKEYLEDIFFTLQKLGLNWDIGPAGPEDFEKNWSQHNRRDLYEESLQKLIIEGNVYACCCTRKSIAENKKKCDCFNCNYAMDKEDVSWKIRVPSKKTIFINDVSKSSLVIDDFVVRKKDGWPAYPITSLADDNYFGVTHIARGEDLLESTARQLYIDELLSPAAFSRVVFKHHDLLKNEQGEKISKSAGSQSVSILKTQSPESILQEFSAWMGWDAREYGKLTEMVGRFSLKI